MEPLTILVADDELGIRSLLYDVLTMRGHTVLCAENGTEALFIVSSHKVDVAYLDIRMPNGDGIAALKAIKRLFPSLPVIMITGCGQRDAIDETMESGAVACLAKPFGVSDILGMLEVVRAA